MSTYQSPISMPARSARTDSGSMARAKAIVVEAVRTLSGTGRDALFAYAMTGSAAASVAIIAAPHFDVLLRGIVHGRG
jgi:hypothetical protein